MIKLIAVDMDGTFLDEKSQYNRQRFYKIYNKLKDRGIRFVVASGNQYEQIISFFKEIEDDLIIVSENGALVRNKQTKFYHAAMPPEHYQFIVDWCQGFDDVEAVVNALHASYVEEGYSKEAKEFAATYAYNLKEVTSLSAIDDTIFKACCHVPIEHLKDYIDDFNRRAPQGLIAVKSGHADMDMMIGGVNKATGLAHLLSLYGIRANELMTFGNSHNDLEMIQLAQYGFAMADADPEVVDVADYLAPSHCKEGVLEVLDAYLETGNIERFAK